MPFFTSVMRFRSIGDVLAWYARCISKNMDLVLLQYQIDVYDKIATMLLEHVMLRVCRHPSFKLTISIFIHVVQTWSWSYSNEEELKMSMDIFFSQYNVLAKSEGSVKNSKSQPKCVETADITCCMEQTETLVIVPFICGAGVNL